MAYDEHVASMLFPKRRFELESALDPPNVHQALAPFVAADTAFGPPAPYLGMVSAGGFEIHPKITYRNTFLPFATGTVVPSASGGGSHVTVTMRIGPIARLFMGIWLSMAGAFMLFVATITIVMGLRGDGGGVVVFAGLFFFVCMFPVFGTLLARHGFGREAAPLERFLREVLRAHTTPPYR